jgi:Fe-S-cluster containining protein
MDPSVSDLCHKCGRCCKVATTFNSQKNLLRMAAQGEQEAIDFLEIFEPFDSIEDARAMDPDQVEQVINLIKSRDDMDLADLTFYHCRYVTQDGLCSIYERRPRCCREAPYHGWAAMPPGCGYEGWQFQQREKHKRMVRDLKTELYTFAQMALEREDPAQALTELRSLKATVEEKLKPGKRYGADFW